MKKEARKYIINDTSFKYNPKYNIIQKKLNTHLKAN